MILNIIKKYIYYILLIGIIFLSGCTKTSTTTVSNLKEELLIIEPTAVFVVDYKKEFLDQIPNGNVYLEDNGVGVIENGEIKLIECKNQNYLFKPIIGQFDYEGEILVDCENNKAELTIDSAYIIGLLTFANNYVEAVEFDNKKYRNEALKLTKSCEPGDQACQVDIILKHFANEIKYISDIRDKEHIEGVENTIKSGIGDCEDISIVILSYLENLGINTKMVMINGHLYGMACGLITEEVKNKYVPVGKPFNYYPLDANTACFALEGTLGKDAYIGFDAGENSEKLLIDPVHWDYWLLDSDGIYENKETAIEELPINITLINGFGKDKGIVLTNNAISPSEKYIAIINYITTENEINKNNLYTQDLVIYDLNNYKQVAYFKNFIEATSGHEDVNGPFYSPFNWINDNQIADGKGGLYIVNKNKYIDISKPDKIYESLGKKFPSTNSNYISFSNLSFSSDYSKGFVNIDYYDETGFIMKKVEKLIFGLNIDENQKIEINVLSKLPDNFLNTKYWVGSFSHDNSKILFQESKIGIPAVTDVNVELNIFDINRNTMEKLGYANVTSYFMNKFVDFGDKSRYLDIRNSVGNDWSNTNKFVATYPNGEVFNVKEKNKIFDIGNEAISFPHYVNRIFSPDDNYILNYLIIPNYLASELTNYSYFNPENGDMVIMYITDNQGRNLGIPLSAKQNINNFINYKWIYSTWSRIDNKVFYTKDGNIYLAKIDEEKNEISLIKYKLTKKLGDYKNLVLNQDGTKLFFVNNNKIFEMKL